MIRSQNYLLIGYLLISSSQCLDYIIQTFSRKSRYQFTTQYYNCIISLIYIKNNFFDPSLTDVYITS